MCSIQMLNATQIKMERNKSGRNQLTHINNIRNKQKIFPPDNTNLQPHHKKPPGSWIWHRPGLRAMRRAARRSRLLSDICHLRESKHLSPGHSWHQYKQKGKVSMSTSKGRKGQQQLSKWIVAILWGYTYQKKNEAKYVNKSFRSILYAIIRVVIFSKHSIIGLKFAYLLLQLYQPQNNEPKIYH